MLNAVDTLICLDSHEVCVLDDFWYGLILVRISDSMTRFLSHLCICWLLVLSPSALVMWLHNLYSNSFNGFRGVVPNQPLKAPWRFWHVIVRGFGQPRQFDASDVSSNKNNWRWFFWLNLYARSILLLSFFYFGWLVYYNLGRSLRKEWGSYFGLVWSFFSEYCGYVLPLDSCFLP